MRLFALLLVCTAAAACAPAAAGPPAGWRLAGGGTLGDRVPTRGLGVALVLDPVQVADCYQPLWRWSEWERANPGRFVLLFSRPPTAEERRALVLRRVREDGVLAVAGAPSPAELAFRDGVVIRESRGTLGAATARVARGGPLPGADELAAYLAPARAVAHLPGSSGPAPPRRSR